MSVNMTFGVGKDGTLGPCKAKPENQGRGNCPHEKHIEMSKEHVDLGVVDRYNEEVLSKIHGSVVTDSTNDYPTKVTPNMIQTHPRARILTKKEIESGAVNVAEKIKKRDWKIIKEFYSKYDRLMTDEERLKAFEGKPEESMEEYLKSDDPTATKLREFLGKGVNLKEFSEIIVQQGGAMTAVKFWDARNRNSVKRCLLSAYNNDMTKERYIASVLFFGGRCCYCNKPLRKNPPPGRQASGEHITPINPENKDSSPGSTRYGNMALACKRCNTERSNQDLNEWITKTKLIKPENKEKALGRIQAFREFALYSEYSKEETTKINNAVKEISDFVAVEKPKAITPEQKGILTKEVNNRIKIAVFELQHH